jgi:hypothetical protein
MLPRSVIESPVEERPYRKVSRASSRPELQALGVAYPDGLRGGVVHDGVAVILDKELGAVLPARA